MADVRPPRVGNADPDTATDEDRAQLILITGLTLAVILVAVVLILNTVIYTENLATRGVDAGGGEAIDFRDGAVEDVTEIMYREHGSNSSDTAVDDFSDSTETYGQTVDRTPRARRRGRRRGYLRQRARILHHAGRVGLGWSRHDGR